jgi:flagellin
MSLRIQTNIEAFDAHRNLVSTEDALAQSMQRLSSGYRINSAADDAAGMAISERLQAQISGLDQAQRNIQDGVSLVQTAEGSLTQVHAMLQRIRDLAVQYQNGTLSTTDQAAIQSEVNQLSSEIERIGSSAQFNGISLLSSTSTITFQVGANNGDTIAVTMISLGSTVNTASFSLASTTGISQIDAAINAVSAADATFGAVENRLQYTLSNASTYEENLTSSESRIRDVDMASEMVNFTKLQILQQAGTSMLSQANQLPQSVLTLLR